MKVPAFFTFSTELCRKGFSEFIMLWLKSLGLLFVLVEQGS